MRRLLMVVLLAALGGCAVPSHLVGKDGDVYVLRTKSVASLNPGGGVYAASLSDLADAQCPAGWEKVGNDVMPGPPGMFGPSYYMVEWRIRCLTASAATAGTAPR